MANTEIRFPWVLWWRWPWTWQHNFMTTLSSNRSEKKGNSDQMSNEGTCMKSAKLSQPWWLTPLITLFSRPRHSKFENIWAGPRVSRKAILNKFEKSGGFQSVVLDSFQFHREGWYKFESVQMNKLLGRTFYYHNHQDISDSYLALFLL